MADHSERPANASFVNNDQVFTSFKNLSLNNSETTDNNESSNESRVFANSSSISFEKPTKFIPQPKTGFVDGGTSYTIPDIYLENFNGNQNRYHTVENNPFTHKYCEVPALVPRSSGAVFGSHNDVAKSDWSEYQNPSAHDSCIVLLAMSPLGSRNLQLLLQKGRINAMFLFKAVYESLVDVMTDRFGYHVFNKIVDYLNHYELATIILNIRPILVDIACSEYGSYSIQKLITLVRDMPVLARVITSTLSTDYFQVMTCRKGRHTVEHCLTILQASDVEVIYEATISTWVGLAKDRQGCISLNFCIDCIPPPYRAPLLYAIVENSPCLSFDPSGTFVLQHVLGLCDQVINDDICCQLYGTFMRLSRMQHGSHLVQKCISLSSLGIFYFVKELLGSKAELKSLVQDQFGNYVIQTALEVSQEKHPAIHCLLINHLQQLEPLIGKTQYALHVFKWLNGVTKF